MISKEKGSVSCLYRIRIVEEKKLLIEKIKIRICRTRIVRILINVKTRLRSKVFSLEKTLIFD